MYKIQRTVNDCGPVAVWNAYEYVSGHRALHPREYRRVYRKIVRECEMDNEYGTYPWVLSRVASSLIRIPKRPTYNKENITKNYNAFILLYAFDGSSAHYVFCTKNRTKNFTKNNTNSKDQYYNVYNYYDPEEDSYSHVKVNEEDFKKYFLNSSYHPKGMEYPQAWEIK